MPKKKFTFISGDLERLTDDQRKEYVVAVAEHLGVPSELGLIDTIFLDAGDGKRQLTLYIKRGATDIIRKNLGISVVSMVPSNGDGYVGFVVQGRDNGGRTEMAVGTVSVKGLTGEKAAIAAMVAQTKACRRMTLQFVGGGFLDESEVAEKTADLSGAAQPLSSLSTLPMPAAAPNADAGKDITDASKAAALPPAASPLASELPILETAASAPEESKKRRPGRPRKVVTLDIPQPNVAFEKAMDAVVEKSLDALVENAKIQLEKKSESIFAGTPCTPEQTMEFRKKLGTYVNDILVKAGFLQSEKLGSRSEKMRLFVQKMFPQADLKNLPVESWTRLFKFMDEKIKSVGAEALVKLINTEIGEDV